MLKRFQPTLVETSFEVLLRLKQERSMKEYRDEFEMLAGPLKIAQLEYLCGIFTNDFFIRAEVRLHQPKSLNEMMDLALLVDGRNEVYSRHLTRGIDPY